MAVLFVIRIDNVFSDGVFTISTVRCSKVLNNLLHYFIHFSLNEDLNRMGNAHFELVL